MLGKQDRIFHAVSHIILILASLSCIIPFLILLVASVTDETYLIANGYSLFPKAFSWDAYTYLAKQASTIMRAYGVTLVITIVGTAVSMIITCLLAYPLSMPNLPGRKFFSFYVVFAMLFNGGLVPTYIMYTQYFHIKDTIWALIVPGLLLRVFNVLLVKSYFTTNIPGEILEAARIDGSSEANTLFRIVLPLSKPIMATIGLMTGLNYWNDWYNGLIYLNDEKLYSLQVLLNSILKNVQYLANNDVGVNITVQLPATSVRMAIAVIAVIPILVIYPFCQKYFVKGIVMGAVKG